MLCLFYEILKICRSEIFRIVYNTKFSKPKKLYTKFLFWFETLATYSTLCDLTPTCLTILVPTVCDFQLTIFYDLKTDGAFNHFFQERCHFLELNEQVGRQIFLHVCHASIHIPDLFVRGFLRFIEFCPRKGFLTFERSYLSPQCTHIRRGHFIELCLFYKILKICRSEIFRIFSKFQNPKNLYKNLRFTQLFLWGGSRLGTVSTTYICGTNMNMGTQSGPNSYSSGISATTIFYRSASPLWNRKNLSRFKNIGKVSNILCFLCRGTRMRTLRSGFTKTS